MKKEYLLFACLCCFTQLYAQETAISENNYLKEDSILWTNYEDQQTQNIELAIKYGTQATPTCFLTDRQHAIQVKCTGLHVELFKPYISSIHE